MGLDTKAPVVRDERFNEIRLYDLADLLKNQFGIDFPKDESSFKKHLNLHSKNGKNGESKSSRNISKLQIAGL